MSVVAILADNLQIRPIASGSSRCQHQAVIPAFDLSLLPGDWFDLRDATSTADAGVDAATLTSELAREIPVDHRLSGVQVEAVAVRRHHKDVIFWLPAEGRWALVHLSWHEESDRNWPGTGIFEDWSDLVNEF